MLNLKFVSFWGEVFGCYGQQVCWLSVYSEKTTPKALFSLTAWQGTFWYIIHNVNSVIAVTWAHSNAPSSPYHPSTVSRCPAWWNYCDLQSNHTKGTLQQLHTPERRTSSPKTKGHWSGTQITPRPISEQRFRSHHLSSDFWKRRLQHFRADGTTRWPNRQWSHFQVEVQASDQSCHFLFVGPPPAQHPFHSKRRDPFLWHQRSHHLFRQVLQFPLLWLIKKAPF